MGRINADDFGSSTPKITPDDLEQDVAILTVAAFETVDVEDDNAEGGKRKTATLTFEETEDRVLWLNKGMVEALVERLGDDPDKWVGKRVPVEKYNARFRGKTYPKVRVMMAEEWDGVLSPKSSRKSGDKPRGKR